MLKLFFHKVSPFSGGYRRYIAKRFFLSDAYKCREAWESRLNHPICEKIDFENIYYNLDLNFERKKRINILDIDVFATSLTDLKYKNELEDILVKLRETPECILLPERTTHAVIRLYVDHASKEEIFNILSNRLTYGVFPDNYLSNLMIDDFLKKGDAVSAVKIAVLQMLQENFDHPITNVLILYSCYNYLTSSQVWTTPKESEGAVHDDDDEEVQKVRVKYLKNPYFDDHFDIQNVNHLIGKTLWMYGLNVNNELGVSSQLIGLVLYGKHEKCVSLLLEGIKKNWKLHSEAVKMAKGYLKAPPKEESLKQSDNNSKEEIEKKESKSSEVDNMKNHDDSSKQKILNLLNDIDEKNLINGNILAASELAVKEAVKLYEEKDILFQCELYKKWETEREDHIQEEIKRNKVEELKGEIRQTKDLLKEEEEKLFFFDREDELEFEIAKKQKEKESVVFYKEKRKKNLKLSADDYNPPDVHQRSKTQ